MGRLLSRNRGKWGAKRGQRNPMDFLQQSKSPTAKVKLPNQARQGQKMRKKKRGGGPGSIGNDNDCSSIFDTQLPGLEHVPFNTNPGEYHAASGAGPPGCGDALSYHRPSHSRASIAGSGIVGINFGGSSWTHPPGMSSVNSPGPPSVEIPPSPASPDQSSISIPASLAGGGRGKADVVSRPSLGSSASSSHSLLAATAATDPASSAQNKMVSKACGMVDELRKLYNLGVELELLQLEEEVPAHLDAVEQLIHRSGRSWQSRLETIEDIGIT
ncbi:hypothetical protein MY4824_002648 [Beauveria thailandica]